MYRRLLIILLLFGTKVSAQDSTLSVRERAMLDSMLNSDEFLKLFKADKKISYATIAVGGSNGIFSQKNNSLNAVQSQTSKIYYTASGAYYHKTGFGLAADGFFADDNGQFKLYQFSLSPSFNYQNKNFSTGISYTRFFEGANTSFSANPFKNDFYANVEWRKPWLRPALAIGYSIGEYEESFDSVITYYPQPPLPPRTVRLTDTVTTKLQNFSATLSGSHSWKIGKLFEKDDELEIRPVALVNFSNQRIDISHSNSIYRRLPFVQNLLKRAFGDGTEKQPFRLQSAALMLEVSYGIGRFVISPQVYVDYYFPETSYSRVTTIYSMQVLLAL